MRDGKHPPAMENVLACGLEYLLRLASFTRATPSATSSLGTKPIDLCKTPQNAPRLSHMRLRHLLLDGVQIWSIGKDRHTRHLMENGADWDGAQCEQVYD